MIIDAGVGTASDVAIAMELGADGVLLNTGIAQAGDPVRMARAMRSAIQAGRDAFLAGRIPKRLYASASSPEDGLIHSPARVSGIMASLRVADVLGPTGQVAQRLPSFEERPRATRRWPKPSIRRSSRAIICSWKPGTGVGKSFAYLVPAILAAAQNENSASARTRRDLDAHDQPAGTTASQRHSLS